MYMYLSLSLCMYIYIYIYVCIDICIFILPSPILCYRRYPFDRHDPGHVLRYADLILQCVISHLHHFHGFYNVLFY